jgi:hypothetical protein
MGAQAIQTTNLPNILRVFGRLIHTDKSGGYASRTHDGMDLEIELIDERKAQIYQISCMLWSGCGILI